MANAGRRNKYNESKIFNQRIEFEESTMKAVFFVRVGIIKTKSEEIRKATGSGLLFLILSAVFPPTRLPRDRPSKVIPITDVQVNTELPIIGATILDDTSSTVITEKPERKEPKIQRVFSTGILMFIYSVLI
jgi:hypothetical protein